MSVCPTQRRPGIIIALDGIKWRRRVVGTPPNDSSNRALPQNCLRYAGRVWMYEWLIGRLNCCAAWQEFMWACVLVFGACAE